MGLIEVVIGATIITVGLIALIQAYSIYVNYALGNQQNVQASYMAEEGLEIAKILRDQSWSANFGVMTSGTPYYFSWTGSAWATTTVPQYIEGMFLRSITLADVYRDSGDLIVATPGTLDPNIKKVTATVAYYQGHATTTRSFSTYIANVYDN